MSTTKVSTRWKTWQLVDKLARLGWGPLDGREWKGLRAVLRAVAVRVDYRTGVGRATVEQIAAAACYGQRWTRQALTDLEDLGLIEWVRGGVQYGKPVPSLIRLSKAALVELIAQAEPMRAAKVAADAVATRARLARIHTIRMVKGKRKTTTAQARAAVVRKTGGAESRGSLHAAVSADPSSRRGDPKGSRPSTCNSPHVIEHVVAPRRPASAPTAGMLAARAALASLGRRP